VPTVSAGGSRTEIAGFEDQNLGGRGGVNGCEVESGRGGGQARADY
jgi:hypothetical protein